MSTNRVTVTPAVYAQVEQYCLLFGKSAEQVITEALSEWMETTGAVRMECVAERHAGGIV